MLQQHFLPVSAGTAGEVPARGVCARDALLCPLPKGVILNYNNNWI